MLIVHLDSKIDCNFWTKLDNSVQNNCCGRKERDDVSITIMGWSNAVHRNNLRILHNSCSDGAQRLSVLVCLTTFNAVTAAIHDCGDLEFQGGNYCRVSTVICFFRGKWKLNSIDGIYCCSDQKKQITSEIWKYSRVHIISDTAFLKILKNPSIVQE